MTEASIGVDKMSVIVNNVYEANISQLLSRYDSLKFLETAKVPKLQKYKWTWQEDKNGRKVSWEYYQTSVIFIGKSGYGKSTTLNKIIGKEVFETDDVEACTKDLYCAVYHLNHSNDCFALCDLPGVGESMQADEKYMEWYRKMLSYSSCVVYVLRADQRDFSIDEKIFKKLFQNKYARSKVILALNCADKIEPVSRSEIISEKQKVNLKRKVAEVRRIFGIDNVVYYSAYYDVGLKRLVQEIAAKVNGKVEN